jgi:hypothetical protein
VAVVLVHRHVVGAQVLDHAADLGDDHVTGVDRGAVLHAGADQRRLGLDQRHGLALHVRTHEARLASSCSRNGIMAVATEVICRGETSM